jgi:chromosome segregation ATPase
MFKKKKPNEKPKTTREQQKPKITKKINQPKYNPENHLSDLENTLDINLQILATFFKSPPKNTQPPQLNFQNFNNILDKIRSQYQKKKELSKKLKEKKSKTLIEIQIFSEKKRKSEEMKEIYQDKTEENEDRLFGKEESVKKLQKRIKEVEIYIHKQTLNLLDKKRQKYYQDFKMDDFLEMNNDLVKQKDEFNKRINQIKKELQKTANENKIYKNKNDEEKNSTNDISKNVNFEEKIKNLTKKYQNKIDCVSSKINLLKNAMEKMDHEIHLFNINKIIRKSSLGIMKEERKNNIKQSIRRIDTEEDDMRYNSFMDFSFLNDNNVTRDKFDVKIKDSIWDLSIINPKDISFIEKKE